MCSDEVEVYVQHGDSKNEYGELVAVIQPGETFGEKGLLEPGATRSATCLAGASGCELLELSKVRELGIILDLQPFPTPPES